MAKHYTVLLCIWLAFPGQAEDSNGDFAIKGAGLQSCGSLVEAWDGRTEDIALYAGWIDGYVTGMNQNLEDTFDVAPWQSVQTLLGLTTEVCRNLDESEMFITAFNDLMKDFAVHRVRQKQNAIAVTNGDTAIALYKETLLRVKQRLSENGFDPGGLDHQFTDQTRTAIEAFQASKGIAVTGLPDQQTLFLLFVRTQ
ncbi:MAG: peptidoglycan-binding domain-containing protein [Pseudomonadota bacterium]